MSRVELKDENRSAIVRWLNRYYPDMFQGSPDIDQNYDDNKKESRVLLKSGLLDTLDDPLKAASHALLMHLFFEWLPDTDPEAAQACRFSVLNVNTAGGMVELERWEKLGGDAQETAMTARRGIGKIVKVLSADTAAETFARFLPANEDERAALLDGGGIQLAVGEDERCESLVHARNVDNNRKRTIDAEESYRRIYPRWLGYEAAMKEKEPDATPWAIKTMFCDWYEENTGWSISPRKLGRVIRHGEGRSTEERPEPGVWRDFGDGDEAA